MSAPINDLDVMFAKFKLNDSLDLDIVLSNNSGETGASLRELSTVNEMFESKILKRQNSDEMMPNKTAKGEMGKLNSIPDSLMTESQTEIAGPSNPSERRVFVRVVKNKANFAFTALPPKSAQVVIPQSSKK